MKRKLKRHLFFVMMLFPSLLLAQNVNINGTVTDKTTGEELVGVSIVEVGTSKGTTTDIDGAFTINVPIGAKLRFSYLGYLTTDVTVQNQTHLSVKMSEEVQEIDEIVVVGAVIKKSDLTGAAARVTSEKLRELPTSNLNQALQGKVPGVYIESNPKPGGNASIKIRGSNSIQYGKDPIYVIDNVMVDNGFDMINPDDIASIDILKDASATAIYGARGANGVVLITTKKGSKGSGRVNYDFWYGTQQFANDIPLLSASDLFDFRVDAYANTYIDKNPGANRESYVERFLSTLDPRRNIAFSKEELEAYEKGETYNWLNEVVRKGAQQNHSLSFAGGGENGNYFVSLGFNDQKGQMINSGYKRYTGKVNLEQSVKPWLKLGSNNSFIYTDEQPVGDDNTFITALRASPLLPISDEYWYMKEGKIDNQGSTNPLRDLNITKDKHKFRFLNSSFVNINPIKGLDIRSTFSVDVLIEDENSYYPTTSSQSYKGSHDGQAVIKKSKNLNWQWDNTVSYNTVFAEVHRLSAMAGTNMSYYSNNWDELKASGFGNDWFDYKKLDGATKKEDFGLSSDYSSYSLLSYFARINYVYDSRYYLTVTGRYDGSSRFGSLNKWGFFPSVAASWNITGEEFMQEQSIFTNLRLRTGYGLSGNQNIPNYGYLTRFSPRSSLDSSVLFNDGMYGNPNLRWETQKQFNLGLDISVWYNRLNIAVDFFHIQNEDLLMERNIAASSGYLKQLDNVGAMVNKGVEIALDVTAIQYKDFKWNIGVNFSADRNKITRLYGDATEIYKLGGYSNNEIQREGNLFVGQSINNLYVYKFDRIVQEEDMDYVNSLDLGSRTVKPGDILPADLHKDGIINDKDRYVVGRKDPDFYGGITTELSYKGISLNVITTYSVGAKRNSYLYETLMSGYGTSAAHADIINRWTPENTNTNVPRAYSEGGRFGLGEVDWAVQDASFFRISAITLSYNLPKKWLEHIYVERLRLYMTGNNLATFTNYKGFDPESGDWYPSSKMFVVGLNLTF